METDYKHPYKLCITY